MQTNSYQLHQNVLTPELERLRIQSSQFKELEKKFLLDAGLKPYHKVLELGAGPGFVSRFILDLIPAGELHAVEINPELHKILENSLQGDPSAKAYLESADNLSLNDNTIDFIYGRFIFQHISDIPSVMNEAYRCSTPGGIIATVDSDDGFIAMFPELPSVTKFLEIAQENQKKRGGNRTVGRQLQSYMHDAGFSHIQSRLFSFSSSDMSTDAFLRMFLGFKSTLVDDPELVKMTFRELGDALNKGGTFANVSIVLTVGQKI
ncbi:MAG: class I SAM-dependent methyltransferase [Pseudobdellovibrionaceae bacterium]|jgi:ubiquinone/menaquinone biosynthesis C-methylase UbiE|nr:class I SAM-dependent methyltransferase [Pseudobdellovibrionaceae bacterium]